MPISSQPLFVPANWTASQGMVLFCFPYAGGSPYVFREWRSALQPKIQVAALQGPGRGTRIVEQPHLAVQETVHEAMPILREAAHRPFAFYGHSLGALVAFEIARQLRRESLPGPCHLFVGAARPPDIGPLLPALHELAEQEFLDALQERYSGLPAAILNDPEVLAIFLPALRADFTAYERHAYQAEPPLECPITGFAGDRDAHIPADTVAGWERHTTGEFDLQVLPGGHFFLDENRSQLLQAIQYKLLATGGALV